ncbi:potassium channel subfamily K member 16 [Caerostris darwini]|uniref:Potassium channel subfamily K member 16 n=1 Tax=Caerostris darwini TaxID=1538125 RepID=A0AAV4Q005_9ARAC|nr:potassium channel subfamily K member 16 [Caerostris darwini]
MLVIYLGYLFLGAGIFVAVERDNDKYVRNASLTSSVLVRRMVGVLREENFTDDQIAGTFNEKYIELDKTNNTKNVTWTTIFGEKFLFSIILISTIGYGNVRPTSSWGKYACILYALIGIPFHVTFLRLISIQFRAALRKAVKNSEKLVPSPYFVGLCIFAYFVFFSTLLLFVPAVAFSALEQWSYYESLYYCFVTLSTIGLGDYVSSILSRYYENSYYFFHVALMFLWLLAGLAFVAMFMNLLSYLIGALILDKLDCKCYKRSIAKKQMTALHNCAIELNWQLAKLKPKGFTKWKELENFVNTCTENPQNITKAVLYDVYDALEELKETIYEDTALLEVPSKLRSQMISASEFATSTPRSRSKSRSFLQFISGQKAPSTSDEEGAPPTITSILNNTLSSEEHPAEEAVQKDVEKFLSFKTLDQHIVNLQMKREL